MKKQYHSNKYEKHRKNYDNPRPQQNTVNTENVTVKVKVENVQDNTVISNGIKDEIVVSADDSNGNPNTTSGLVPQEKFLINVKLFYKKIFV